MRAWTAASEDVRKKRQQLLSFLLPHGRIFTGRKTWDVAHTRWLAVQKFDHPAQKVIFHDQLDVVTDAGKRLRRLDQQFADLVLAWFLAPVVAAYQAPRGISFIVAVTFACKIGDVAPVRQSPAVDGFSRLGAIGAFDRGQGATR